MTALDRALSWFLDPASPARDGLPADAPAVGAGHEPLTGPAASGPAGHEPLAGALASGRLRALPGRVDSAVVLGRPGQAEPVAAALALALSQGARPRAATVAVIAAASPDADPAGPAAPASATYATAATRETQRSGEGWAPRAAGLCDAETRASGAIWLPADPGDRDTQRAAGGGTRAARRLAARLDAHGLPARPRGRLAWVPVPREHPQAAARRAVLVGAPAVLAVTAPRTQAIEELLAEQDLLLLVMAAPDGPLARVAALAPGGVPVVVTRPLPRGPARSLALAGASAPRSVRELLAGGVAAAAAVRAAA
jgi:hypothetical protein